MKIKMLFFIFIFLFGLAVGSFLNVLISRLPQEQGIGGRSHCPKCGHILAWQDLVPILSFVLLRGKCRYCGKPISWQYPIVELVTGILFVFLANQVWVLGFENLDFFRISDFGFRIFIVSCLIVIFVSDLKYFIIPDQIILAGIIGFFIFKLFWILNFGFFSDFGFRISDLKSLLNLLLSALAAGAFFFMIVLVTRGKGMGLGDVKLAFLMGLILGWPKILVALLLAFVSGALVGLGLIVAGKAKMKSQIPFGTFLAASTFLVMIVGEAVILKFWPFFA